MPNFKAKFRDNSAIFNKVRGEFMKKAAKSIAVVFVVLALCLGALAGSSDSSTSPVGIWKITSAETLGMSVPIDRGGYHE